MESKREGALVGLFVLVAAGVLVVTVVLLSGTLGHGDVLIERTSRMPAG